MTSLHRLRDAGLMDRRWLTETEAPMVPPPPKWVAGSRNGPGAAASPNVGARGLLVAWLQHSVMNHIVTKQAMTHAIARVAAVFPYATRGSIASRSRLRDP